MTDIKREILSSLYACGDSFKVTLHSRGCSLPEFCYDQPHTVLEIGWALKHPVSDFQCDDERFVCTLRFGTREQLVKVPLHNVLHVEGEDSLHMFAVPDEFRQSLPPPNTPVPHTVRPSARRDAALKRSGFRVIDGGKRINVESTEPPPRAA